MRRFVVELAGLPIEARCAYPLLERMCASYRSSKAPALSLCPGPDGIEAERRRCEESDARAGVPPRRFPDDSLEALAFYRALAERLSDFDAMLMHGSAFAFDGRGVVVTAASGVGKSTHARLWRERYGERVRVINDDKPILRRVDGVWRVYGTPWDGKHHLSANISAPLDAVCLLSRGERNAAFPVEAREGLAGTLAQIYRPTDAGATARTLDLLEDLLARTRVFQIQCTPEPEAAEAICRALFEEKTTV